MPSRSRLRSDAWLVGDDEVALEHRAALRPAGYRSGRDRRGGRARPLIGIACTASDLNRCDLGLASLADAVRRGVLAAGGLPLSFPVMSLSEDLMKPTVCPSPPSGRLPRLSLPPSGHLPPSGRLPVRPAFLSVPSPRPDALPVQSFPTVRALPRPGALPSGLGLPLSRTFPTFPKQTVCGPATLRKIGVL